MRYERKNFREDSRQETELFCIEDSDRGERGVRRLRRSSPKWSIGGKCSAPLTNFDKSMIKLARIKLFVPYVAFRPGQYFAFTT